MELPRVTAAGRGAGARRACSLSQGSGSRQHSCALTRRSELGEDCGRVWESSALPIPSMTCVSCCAPSRSPHLAPPRIAFKPDRSQQIADRQSGALQALQPLPVCFGVDVPHGEALPPVLVHLKHWCVSTAINSETREMPASSWLVPPPPPTLLLPLPSSLHQAYNGGVAGGLAVCRRLFPSAASGATVPVLSGAARLRSLPPHGGLVPGGGGGGLAAHGAAPGQQWQRWQCRGVHSVVEEACL